jgi:hypothetical protein
MYFKSQDQKLSYDANNNYSMVIVISVSYSDLSSDVSWGN